MTRRVGAPTTAADGVGAGMKEGPAPHSREGNGNRPCNWLSSFSGLV